MNRMRRWQVAVQITLASSLMGTMFQAGCLGKVARNVNPCGTILDCDPLEWDLMMLQEEYPDWELDPTCTIPGLCGGQWPPPGGAGTDAGAATDTTTTTTTGTTTTGTTTTTGLGTGLTSSLFGGSFGF